MVFFLTGVPGSGKTYYLVNYAEKNIEKVDKKTNEKQYLQVVHNISGYKRGFYVDFGVDYLPKILSLNEYFLKVKKDLNKDDLLIKKAEELGIYKILLIIDECHLYFVNDFSEKGKKQYYALLWFISYHRHLYIDLVLATQNLSLVDYKFKAFAEYYVKAVPSSMRFNLNPFASPKFTYYYYPDSKMWNDTRFKTEHIKADKKIFDLYTSGDAVKKQKVYLQTLLLIGVSLIVVVGLWMAFKYSFTRNVPKDDKIAPVAKATPSLSSSNMHQTINHRSPKSETLKYVNDDIQFDVVTCSTLSGNCSSELTSNKIHYFLFSKLIKLELIEPIHKVSQYGIQTYYLILHISKEAYISKFLIKHPNIENRRKYKPQSFDFGIDDIKKHLKD